MQRDVDGDAKAAFAAEFLQQFAELPGRAQIERVEAQAFSCSAIRLRSSSA
jgi:hypothetical protein